MKKLRTLALEDASITDAGLAHLAGLTELDDLDLMRVHISDKGLAHLKNLTSCESCSCAPPTSAATAWPICET